MILMKLIKRNQYLNKLITFKDKQLIKVITGIRRCGKSKLLEIYQQYLKNQGIEEDRIIYINFEDYDFSHLNNGDKLYEYIKERLEKDKMTYIFLDEIQHISDFARIVDSLYIKDNVDIYITGSNAYMLSSEIATLISGRYVEIKMLPLSFKEYVDSLEDKNDINKKYINYLTSSSFPYALALKDQPNEIRDYLDAIYNTIVIKDIASRHKISDMFMLQSIIRYIFDNIGNTLSTKKIADTMTSNGRKIDFKTIEKYLNYLLESFVIYRANRYNIKGKQYLKSLEKYYIVDIGMRYMLLGTRSVDVGHILENIIYLELLRREYEVYVGKVDNLEVDFVAISKNNITYFQVSASVRDEMVLQRELLPLKRIRDSYPKFILTLDDDPEADYDGIKRINALSWLLQIN